MKEDGVTEQGRRYHFAEEVEMARKAVADTGITAYALAKRAGVARSYAWRFLTGKPAGLEAAATFLAAVGLRFNITIEFDRSVEIEKGDGDAPEEE